MMYIYDVGYGTYEESEYTQFMSDRQLDDIELSVVVEDCLYECLKVEIERKVEYAKQDKDPWFVRDTITVDGIKISSPSLQNLFMATNGKHENIFVLEMEKRGLKPVQFENRFSVFGWVSSVSPEDWGEQNDDTSRDLAKKLCRRIEDEGMVVEARKNEDSVSE